jgi:YbbR domain-containing protein
VDLSQSAPGQNYFRLTVDNIRAPLGTEITKISPSSIRLQLEAVKTGSVQVKAKLTGKLPKSLRLKSIWVEPAFIILQGPETVLTKTRELFTDPLDLSQIQESRKVSIGLDIESPQIHLAPNQPSRVVVEIQVERFPELR